MRRPLDPKAPRLYLQHLVLGSLARSFEDEAERRRSGGRIARLRARRAEREAARLRELLVALRDAPPLEHGGTPHVDPASVKSRIAAYTYGVAATATAGGPTALPPAHVEARSHGPRLRVLPALWVASVAALVASLAWAGIGSAASAAADVALLLATLALFARYLRSAVSQWGGGERRSGVERRQAGGRPPAGVERRSGYDRRLGPVQPA